MTNNLKQRLKMHHQGKAAAYTRSFGVAGLVYSENCPSKSQALKREAEIKSWPRSKKLDWIKSHA